jgi:hypothetical protein
MRTVTDLELHLGTWVAWGRRTADDPDLLGALGRLRDEYSATAGPTGAGRGPNTGADGRRARCVPVPCQRAAAR